MTQTNIAQTSYHTGLNYLKAHELEKATDAFQKTLSIAQDHIGAWYQLGVIAMKQYRFEAAIECFKEVIDRDATLTEAHVNLGHCYTHLKETEQARMHYREALTLDPEQPDIHFNLGVLAETKHLFDHAIQHYQAALKHDPNYFEAHNNIAVCFLVKQHAGFALKHFKEALRLKPEDKALQYKIATLEQHPSLDAAPTEYITSLFDQYADHYDQHLMGALDYQVPQLLLNVWLSHGSPAGVYPAPQYGSRDDGKNTLSSRGATVGSTYSLLDLGCGTGLCGDVFKAYIHDMEGVDLSQNMLAQAKIKDCYQALYQEDILSFLQTSQKQYDIMLAGDVLMYLGKLDNLFKAVSKKLKQQGIFLFNIEVANKPPYNASASGRFVHHPDYINTLAKQHGFTIHAQHPATTRLQNNTPVHGMIFLLYFP